MSTYERPDHQPLKDGLKKLREKSRSEFLLNADLLYFVGSTIDQMKEIFDRLMKIENHLNINEVKEELQEKELETES